MDFTEFKQFLKGIKKMCTNPEFTRAIQELVLSQDGITAIYSAISLTEQYAKAIHPDALGFLYETKRNYDFILQQADLKQSNVEPDLSNDPDEIADSIEEAISYISDEPIISECVEQVHELRTTSWSKWTFERIATLLSLLIALFTLLFQMLPDEQIDKIISQQEQTITELESDNQSLLQTLNSLGNSIDTLRDEIEALCDDTDRSVDFSDGQGEENSVDSLNKDDYDQT